MRLVFLAIVALFITTGCVSNNNIQNSAPGSFVSDTVLETKVKAAMVTNRGLEGFKIHVNARKGVVQLSGFVDNDVTKQFAGQIAHSVDGVNELINNLIVTNR